ncbi:cytochrome B [Methylobacterium sp. DM1]|nr:cytochrome B [Methylobacterium sp. DM1]
MPWSAPVNLARPIREQPCMPALEVGGSHRVLRCRGKVSGSHRVARRLVGGGRFTLGFTLFVLVLLRGASGQANLAQRPQHPGHLGRAAAADHLLIYTLMVVVPGFGLLRQYGSGKPFTPFSIPLMPGHDDKVAWMVAPDDLLHYWLAFTVVVMLVGHIIMAFLHRKLGKEDVLARVT